ncbi:MAG: DUF5916 domain-containing protein [Bacteroidota bacterium]
MFSIYSRWTLCFLLWTTLATAGPDHTYTAVRCTTQPKIDGKLNDPVWLTAFVAGDFLQNEPVQDAPVSQRTEVRILYDDASIYVCAMLYDTHPDSILHQLGDRDQVMDINADVFRLGFDPYNARIDGYVFDLSASGVQGEQFGKDNSFDAVWESAVALNDSGWSLEIRIPWSQLRFPDQSEQVWGLQFARQIRRYREYDQWSPVRRDLRNPLVDWGTLIGIRDVKPPLRLTLTPYLSFVDQRSPAYVGGEVDHYENAYSYSGGADLKLGLNESFTLDMTLLPDFSQVQSDSRIRNLTAFEQIFEERRPFFKEGTSLFSTGGLLYSRRIGKTPTYFYSVVDSLGAGEELVKNPTTARLLNATKLSGRTVKGLGIGILNAVTGNTYAEIKKIDGQRRRVLTEPLTNYSVVVLDQQLKNNSRVWFANASTLREGSYRDADVWSAGTLLENKSHSIRLTSSYANSLVFEQDAEKRSSLSSGHQALFKLEKISGNFQFGGSGEFGDSRFDKNDLGVNFLNNYSEANLFSSYNLYKPFLNFFREGNASMWLSRGGRLNRGNEQTFLMVGSDVFLLTNSMFGIFLNGGTSLANSRDWFEPRVENRYYLVPRNSWFNSYFSSNYNKPLAVDFGINSDWSDSIGQNGYGIFLKPIIRFNDHFSMNLGTDYYRTWHDRGFCTFDSLGGPVFGRRNIRTLTNTISSSYQFSPLMSLTLNVRHYWSQGIYDRYYSLLEDGGLEEYATLLDGSLPFAADFNSNYFNVDLVFNWVFAPGSQFLVTYKNQIYSDDNTVTLAYSDNLRNTLRDPQTNSIAIKVLYFLDYERVTSRRRKG